MTTARSFTNSFELTDHTQALLTIPVVPTLLNETGLFKPVPVTQHTITFEERIDAVGVVLDQVRGSRPQTVLNNVRKIHAYSTTNHQLSDVLTPSDLQGKSAYGDLSTADTEAAAMVRKMEKIRRYYDLTLEAARFKTLATGAVFAPNGTITGNFYTDFGVTRKEVDFVLGTATTDVVAKVEEVIASFLDASNGGVVTGITCYASPEFFAALISHAKVQQAYQYYAATEGQSILRNRAGGNSTGMYRRFEYAGVTFIEVRTSVPGVGRLVPVKDAIFVATGVDDAFETYFSPANRFGFENTLGEMMYLWSFKDQRQTEITLEAESSFLNVLRRPAMIARGYIT